MHDRSIYDRSSGIVAAHICTVIASFICHFVILLIDAQEGKRLDSLVFVAWIITIIFGMIIIGVLLLCRRWLIKKEIYAWAKTRIGYSGLSCWALLMYLIVQLDIGDPLYNPLIVQYLLCPVLGWLCLYIKLPRKTGDGSKPLK